MMLYLFIIGGILLLDYKVKEHVNNTRLQGETHEILNGKLVLRNCHNKDTAFGTVKLGDENCRELSTLGLGGVLAELCHQVVHGGSKLSKIGLSMAFGGGLGNYLDRKTNGYVTDYVSIGAKNKKISKMVFNISDFCIFCGAFLWVISGILPEKKEK